MYYSLNKILKYPTDVKNTNITKKNKRAKKFKYVTN